MFPRSQAVTSQSCLAVLPIYETLGVKTRLTRVCFLGSHLKNKTGL